jgi:hypothetical protein
MSTIYGLLVAVGLAAWLVVSALNQFGLRAIQRIKRSDFFSLIPRWTFFAPNPSTTDYQLLYRDRLRDGRVTGWRAATRQREMSLVTALWNPSKRRQKAVIDFTHGMLRQFRRSPEHTDSLQLTLAYIALLLLAASAEHEAAAESTQFAVLQTHGFHPLQDPRLAMHSRFHALR